jgi:recombination protein RecT
MSDAPVVIDQPVNQERTVAVLADIVNGLNRQDRRDTLRALLGNDAAVERFIAVTLHSISGNNDILSRCTPASIIEAVREAATLDLEPTGILGEAWIVRHGNRAVLRVGYRGFLKLIRRSQQIKALDCQIVYDHDPFALRLGTDPGIDHTPSLGERGGYKGAYAWARMSTGELVIEWMTTDDIEQARRVSQAKNAGPWKDWWGEMARKTVIRRLAKRLPLSTIAANAVAIDEEADKHEVEQEADPTRKATLRLLAEATGGDLPKQEAPESQAEAPAPGQVTMDDVTS